MSNTATRTVLITGASSGFGWATALKLNDGNTQFILTARRKERLEALAKQLAPAKVHLAVFDIRNTDEILKFVKEIPSAFRDIDVLVNNAGLSSNFKPTYEASQEEWDVMIDTNVRGLLTLTRQILPLMRARNTGHIVNISSIAGNYHYPCSNVYGATKAFVTYFSMALRADLAGENIRVSNIEPGAAETEFSVVRFKGDQQAADAVYEGMDPLTADDIADCIAFCVNAPKHVNVNRMEIMPVMQAPAGIVTKRRA